MARIRTIKPGFFTSDDVCALSPLARLLFIGLWCEADREGRMEWKPRTFKRSYLPDDIVDPDAVAGELVKQGVIIIYGQGLAYIPSFRKHQIVNARESASKLPDPHVQKQDATVHGNEEPVQEDAQTGACTDMHMHTPTNTVGKGKEEEGKGKEVRENLTEERGALAFANAAPPDLAIPDFLKRTSNAKADRRVETALGDDQGQPAEGDPGRTRKAGSAGHCLPADWTASAEQLEYARAQGCDPAVVALDFSQHFWAKAGPDSKARDWNSRFQRWCRRDAEFRSNRPNGSGKPSWEKAHEAEIDAIIARGEGGSA